MEASRQRPFSRALFSQARRRATVTLFLAVWNGIARPSAFLLKRVWGRCGAFTPLGWVAENLEGSKRGRDAEAPLPADRRERLAAECCGLEGGLSREGETVLLECFFYGAINIRVLISLGAVDEGGGRGMGRGWYRESRTRRRLVAASRWHRKGLLCGVRLERKTDWRSGSSRGVPKPGGDISGSRCVPQLTRRTSCSCSRSRSSTSESTSWVFS